MRLEGGSVPGLLRMAVTIIGIGIGIGSSSGCDGLGPLRDGDPNVDVRVIQRASFSSDASLATPLIEILQRRSNGETGDPIFHQTLAASLALGDRGDRDAIPVLIRLLADEEEWVRANAAEALLLLGGPEARAAVAGIAGDPSPLVQARLSVILPDENVKGKQ